MGFETELFGDMTDLIAENANIIIKDTYWDYHPDWPRHSAFYTIKKDKNGSSPYLDKDIFLNLLDELEKNRNDALLWKLAIELYFDLKLGRLTEKKIDKALNMARGLEGALMKEPLRDFKSEQDSGQNVDTASFLTFANQLRQELQSPWLKEYLKTNKPVM